MKLEFKQDIGFLENLATEIRSSAFDTIVRANSGHLGACSSSCELFTSLYFGGILKYNPNNPDAYNRDRVYVRGHVGPLRYKIFSLLEWILEEELKQYRKINSRLKGHESMFHTPGVDMTPSGSLGMLLSYAVGSAIVTNQIGINSKHYVFLGDGEEQEGNISEAARHASSIGIQNLVCILDKNKKQLSRAVKDSDGNSDLNKIWTGYGWEVKEIENGHDIKEIIDIFSSVNFSKPTFIIANTQKGKGIKGCENNFNGYHTISSCSDISLIKEEISSFKADRNKLLEKIQDISSNFNFEKRIEVLKNINQEYDVNLQLNSNTNNNLDKSQGTYFMDLRKVVEEQKFPFYFLTPDFLNENVVEMLKLRDWSTFIDTGIREQHLVAMAHGISQTNPNARILINFGDAFLYRASDQLNAAAQGKSKFIFLSEMSGLTQGQNGESHQTSGHPAIPIFMPGVNYYEPADVNDLYMILNYAFSNNNGINFIRSHKGDINLLSTEYDTLNINNRIVFESSLNPQLTLVGTGLPVENLVKTAKNLEKKLKIGSRVINLISPNNINNDFEKKIIPEAPLFTVYNGNASILRSLVSDYFMSFESKKRPSKIIGKGFEFGDTGSLEDLLIQFKLDPNSLFEMIKTELKL